MTLPDRMPRKDVGKITKDWPEHDLVLADEETVAFGKSIFTYFSTHEERLVLVERGIIDSAYESVPFQSAPE